MEAFGLLHFLKSVFPFPDESPIGAKPDEPPVPTTSDKKNVPPVENPTGQNAFTSFVATHDARIKRVKR